MNSRSKSNGKIKSRPAPKPRAKAKANGGATSSNGRPEQEKAVLVLQGGGALGSYQAGAFAELARRDRVPDWVAGISIGAINAAIIVGNPPERRVERLRTFWELVSSHLQAAPPLPEGEGRSIFNETSASLVALYGAPGFFAPRLPSPLLFPPGIRGTLSLYETKPLRDTLLELVDFDLINTNDIRLSVGAVNVRTGNFRYFDSAKEEIRPEHIMASGALPPGFPPIEIDGQCYWDGGLVSNTPLQYVLEDERRDDMLVFQIDLFSARGPMPGSLSEVTEREKDIRYSSRTRLNTDVFRYEQRCRRAIHRILEKLPDDLKNDPDVKTLANWSDDRAVTIVHLIKRRAKYSTEWKDFEFSRISMEEHWNEGVRDVQCTVEHPDWARRSKPVVGVNVLDLTCDEAQGRVQKVTATAEEPGPKPKTGKAARSAARRLPREDNRKEHLT